MTAMMNFAFLILRLMTGLTMIAHGSQKLLGWFGGSGLKTTLMNFEKQGLKPGGFWVGLAGLGELGGGLSLALGFLTPLGAAGIFGAMFMATFKTHWKNGFFVMSHGYEYALTQMVVSIFFGLAGPGGYSLDRLLGITLPQAPLFIGLAVVALIVDVIGIQLSSQAQAAAVQNQTR